MNWNYEKEVGQTIRRLRKQRNMSQDRLAAQMQVRECDLTRSALAKIEVGQRHVYVDELKALREIFDVPYEELFV